MGCIRRGRNHGRGKVPWKHLPAVFGRGVLILAVVLFVLAACSGRAWAEQADEGLPGQKDRYGWEIPLKQRLDLANTGVYDGFGDGKGVIAPNVVWTKKLKKTWHDKTFTIDRELTMMIAGTPVIYDGELYYAESGECPETWVSDQHNNLKTYPNPVYLYRVDPDTGKTIVERYFAASVWMGGDMTIAGDCLLVTDMRGQFHFVDRKTLFCVEDDSNKKGVKMGYFASSFYAYLNLCWGYVTPAVADGRLFFTNTNPYNYMLKDEWGWDRIEQKKTLTLIADIETAGILLEDVWRYEGYFEDYVIASPVVSGDFLLIAPSNMYWSQGPALWALQRENGGHHGTGDSWNRKWQRKLWTEGDRKIDGALAPIYATPAVRDGIVYVGDAIGSVWALELLTGRKIWSKPFFTPPPSLTGHDCGDRPDDSVEPGVGDRYGDPPLYVHPWFDPDMGATAGMSLWEDTLFFGSLDKHVYAVDIATGRLRWKTNLNFGITSDIVVYDGVVYTVTTGLGKEPGESGHDNVFAIDGTTGEIIWGAMLPGRMGAPFESPLVFNHRLYIPMKGELFVLGDLPRVAASPLSFVLPPPSRKVATTEAVRIDGDYLSPITDVTVDRKDGGPSAIEATNVIVEDTSVRFDMVMPGDTAGGEHVIRLHYGQDRPQTVEVPMKVIVARPPAPHP